MRKFVACAVALACVSAPAMAEEKCWTAKEMTAARIRDLQSVLMVGALQCRATEHNLLADFNQFVVAGRALIVSENDVLKARFVRLQGAKEGNRTYDSFTTALANDHSATTSRMVDFCGQAQALAVESVAALALGKADEALELIAERLGEHPRGVGAGCADVKPVTVVATMDPKLPAPLMAVSAPAPVQQVAVAAAQPGTVYMLVPAPAAGVPAGTATVVIAPQQVAMQPGGMN